LAQQRLGSLDPSCHQIGIGRLPVRNAELSREVRRRHQGSTGKRGDVERLRVLAVDQVAGAAQVREIGKLFRRHERERSGGG
jgi:hypothetical protein